MERMAVAPVIYPLLPTMSCCDHCGDCCGPVTVSPHEAEVIEAYIQKHDIRWREAGLLICGFYDAIARACDIYPVRPFACRLFGVAHEMTCPHHPEAAVTSFPADHAVSEGWMPRDSRSLEEIARL